MKIFNKFFGMIKKSCEKNNEVSSTRVTSFVILLMIVLFCLYFLGIGIYIVVASATVSIPGELLIVFGSLLTHQLTLLGINKYAETKQKNGSKIPPSETDR